MADLLEMIATISFVLGGIFLVLSIILWVKFKIPTIYANLKGKDLSINKSESKDNASQLNMQTGTKFYYSSSVDRSPVYQSQGIQQNQTDSSESTELLTEETALLDPNATMLLDEEATTLLESEDVEATVLLSSQCVDAELQMIDDIVMLHTREVIPLNKN